MSTPAFAAGSVVAAHASTFSSTRSCVITSRSNHVSIQARTVTLRRTSMLPSKHYSALASICNHGCVGRCVYEQPSAAAIRMTVSLSKGEQVIADLMTENAAFVRGEPKVFDGVPQERARLASEGQTPKIAIIACADSRVAPEIIFRANVGELFVMRAAGNTTWGNEVLGSLEFAVNVLKVDAVMVLGHTKCGAVAAAVGGGDPLPGALGAHITNISMGLEGAGGITSDVDAAVERNVVSAVKFLRKDQNGCISVGEKNGLAVRGGVYDISTGEVKLVNA